MAPRKTKSADAKAAPKADGKAQAATSSEVQQQITPRKLKGLLKAAKSAYTDVRSIAGTLGEQIAQAVEHDNLHKKAFSTLRMMDRLTPEKLADYWDTLQYYVDISGLGQRAASAPRLAFDEKEDAKNEDDEAPSAANVAPFPERAGAA